MKLIDRGIALAMAVAVVMAVNGGGSGGGSVARAESEVPATNPLSGDAKALRRAGRGSGTSVAYATGAGRMGQEIADTEPTCVCSIKGSGSSLRP